MICPCDTGREYDECCGRLHQGKLAPTAVALMRSRYSAFVLRLDDYLFDTWHSSTRPRDTGDRIDWCELIIEEVWGGKAWDERGEVQFTARYSGPGVPGRIRERSQFVFEQGRWWYLDGVQLA